MADKTIKELTREVTQEGAAVPAGYRFDPKRNPPLIKVDAKVATEQQKAASQDTGDATK